MMWIYTYDSEKGIKVKAGQVVNGVFYKEVKKGNIMQLNDSVGIQRDVLDELGNMGIENIKCRIEGRGIFISMWSDWMQPGVWQKEWKNHGLQRFLPIKDMKAFGGSKSDGAAKRTDSSLPRL